MLPKLKNICNNGFPSVCVKFCDACIDQASRITQVISIRQKSDDSKDDKDSDKDKEAKRVLEECFGPEKPILDVTKAHHENSVKYSKPPEVQKQECNVVIKEVFAEDQHATAVTRSSTTKDNDDKLITKIETVEETDTVEVARNDLAKLNHPPKIFEGKKIVNINENNSVDTVLNHNSDEIDSEQNKRVVPNKINIQDEHSRNIKVWQSKLVEFIEVAKSYDALRSFKNKDNNLNQSTHMNNNETDKRPMCTGTNPPLIHGKPTRLQTKQEQNEVKKENVVKKENRKEPADANFSVLKSLNNNEPDRVNLEAQTEMKNFVYDPATITNYSINKTYSQVGSINANTKHVATKLIKDIPRNKELQKRKEINLISENDQNFQYSNNNPVLKRKKLRKVLEITGNVENTSPSDSKLLVEVEDGEFTSTSMINKKRLAPEKMVNYNESPTVPDFSEPQEYTQDKFYMLRPSKASYHVKNKTKSEISLDLQDFIHDINQKGLKGGKYIDTETKKIHTNSLYKKEYVDDTFNVINTESEKRIEWMQRNNPYMSLDLSQVLGSVHYDISTTRADNELESTADIVSCINNEPDTVLNVYKDDGACNENKVPIVECADGTINAKLENFGFRETKTNHELYKLHKQNFTAAIPQIKKDNEHTIITNHAAQTVSTPFDNAMTLQQMLDRLRERNRRRMFEEYAYLNVTSKCPKPCSPKHPSERRTHPPPIPPRSPCKMPPGCVPSCTPPCPASPCPPPKTMPRPKCPPKPRPKVCPEMPRGPKCPPLTPKRAAPKCPLCEPWPPTPKETYPKACPPWKPPTPPNCPSHPQCPPQTPPQRKPAPPYPPSKPDCPQPRKKFMPVAAPISLCAKCGEEVEPYRLTESCLPISVSPKYKGSLSNTNDYSTSTTPCQPHLLPFPVTCDTTTISPGSSPRKRNALKNRVTAVVPVYPKKGPGSGSPHTWMSSLFGLAPGSDDLRLLKDIFRGRLFLKIFNFLDFSRKDIGVRDIILVGFAIGKSTATCCAGIYLNFREKNYEPWVPIPSMITPDVEKEQEQKTPGGLPELPSPKFKPWELNKSFKQKPPHQN